MSDNKESGIEYAFQELEESHRILIDKSSDPIFSISSEGRYLYVNQAYAKEVEESVDGIIGKTIWNVFDREEADKRFATLNYVFQNGKEKVIEVRVSQADGDKYFTNTIIPIKDSHGKVIKVICSSKDISQRKWAEEKLLESKKRLDKESDQMQKLLTFLRQSEIGGPEITSFVIEGCIKISESELGFFGLVDDAETVMMAHLWSEQAMKTCAIDNKPVKFPIKTAGIWAESIRTSKPFVDNDFQKLDLRKKGYPVGHLAIQRYLSIPVIRENKVVAVLGLANKKQDYTDADLIHLSLFIENVWILFEKKEAEVAIIRNEAYFRALIENASDIITILNDDGVIRYNSTSIERVLGYRQSELINKHIFEFIHTDDLPDTIDIFTSIKQKPGLTSSIEFRILDKAGSWRYFESTWRNLLENDIVNGIIINSHDISERKYSEVFEKEMYRFDQLNTIGQMAAGIGHEIRNPMTTVRGYLQLLQNRVELQPFTSQFELMIDELDRANSIISEFLSLAKDRVVELKVQSLKKIVEKIFPLIQADGLISDKYIHMELEEVSEIPLDKKEIHQLILNLVLNGSQAMSPGGTMKIRTFMDKGVVVLTVQDDGAGIAPEVLGKIGTPFFTTKDNGTGLGLAVCYSIAARHNAKIEIETGPTGTTFFVRFKQ